MPPYNGSSTLEIIMGIWELVSVIPRIRFSFKKIHRHLVLQQAPKLNVFFVVFFTFFLTQVIRSLVECQNNRLNILHNIAFNFDHFKHIHNSSLTEHTWDDLLRVPAVAIIMLWLTFWRWHIEMHFHERKFDIWWKSSWWQHDMVTISALWGSCEQVRASQYRGALMCVFLFLFFLAKHAVEHTAELSLQCN